MSARATIDIGTNTCKLLIVSGNETDFSIIADEVRVSRLGEGLRQSGSLSAEAIARTCTVLKRFKQVIDLVGAKLEIASATQAVREADNRDEFLKPAAEVIGSAVTLIDGDTEAKLIWASVRATMQQLTEAPHVVIDIGGGSTEFVFATGDAIDSFISLPIGSVVLTETHAPTAPLPSAQASSLQAHIDETITVIQSALAAARVVIGTSGTATTLTAMEHQVEPYDGNRITGASMSEKALGEWIARLAAMTVEARQAITGLDPKRADCIVAGATIMARAMEMSSATELVTCDRGLRYGLLRWRDVID